MKIYPIVIKLFVTLICGIITLFSFQWFPMITQPAAVTPSSTDDIQILPTITSTPLPTINPTSTATVVKPFVNLSGLLLVTVEFYPDMQPQILSVQPLESGRVTPSMTGDTQLKMIDVEGKTVFDLTFKPIFVFGEPAKKHDSIRMTFIVPNGGKDSLIQISSTEWLMEYKIDGN